MKTIRTTFVLYNLYLPEKLLTKQPFHCSWKLSFCGLGPSWIEKVSFVGFRCIQFLVRRYRNFCIFWFTNGSHIRFHHFARPTYTPLRPKYYSKTLARRFSGVSEFVWIGIRAAVFSIDLFEIGEG